MADHVAALQRHLPPGCLDLVLANDNLSVPPETGGGQTQYVAPTPPAGVPLITADLVDEARPWRHDSGKLGRVVMGLVEQGSGEQGRRVSPEGATHFRKCDAPRLTTVLSSAINTT
ncbi:MAG: hypothetical protein IPH95_01320 [Candidatus Promineofilum sp.]|nr:hypothetical protein [Promineifilum sp.]